MRLKFKRKEKMVAKRRNPRKMTRRKKMVIRKKKKISNPSKLHLMVLSNAWYSSLVPLETMKIFRL